MLPRSIATFAAAATALLTLAAQTEVAVSASPAIIGTTWTATEIMGEAAGPRATSTLRLSSEAKAGGEGGCNSWFSEITLGDGTISFANVTSTGKGCLQAVMLQEKAYYQALSAATGWRMEEGAFLLLDATGETLVRFTV